MDDKKFLSLSGLSSLLVRLKQIFATSEQGKKADTAYTHSQSAHAPSNAERNVIIGIQKNGSDVTTSTSTRKANITVPTKLSELTNDSGFKTTDTNTTYSLTKSGSTIILTGSDGKTTSVTDANTTYSNMTGATTSVSGKAGLVPAPASGASNRYLRSDGSWAVPPDTNTTYNVASSSSNGLMSSNDKSKLDGIANGANNYVHPSYTQKSSGFYKVTVDSTGHVSATTAVTKNDITALGIPSSDTNTWIALKGATSSSAGTAGYAPAPSAGASNRYLRSDGTWSVPPDTNTTYSNMTAATSTSAGKAGLVPAPSAGSQSKYLRGDGTWQTPPNTTYTAATSQSAGLMSAADKSKLDGIANNANNYSLPTASSSTLGGVKTTSSVSSTSGLTACPIISGVPYYKDTNNTYSLSSFGITATAAELNKLDGITATTTELNFLDGVESNIQTQLDGKSPTTHNHSATNITSGTLSIARGGTGGTSATSARTSLGAVNFLCQATEPSSSAQNINDFWLKEV